MVSQSAGGARWRFAVLGPLSVERDGIPVAVPGRRPRTVLALLLMQHGRPLPARRLAAELWGDEQPASATSALHVHLSKLRAVFGDLLVTTATGYRLDPGRYELDVDHFDALLEAAYQDRSQAGGLTARAFALWRDDPLCDLAPERSLARWTQTLGDKLVRATVLRIDAELEAGHAEALVPELEALIERHRFEERLWEQLMLAQYRSGQRVRAIATYRRAEQLFTGELGVRPGAGLTGLCAQMLRGQEAPLA